MAAWANLLAKSWKNLIAGGDEENEGNFETKKVKKKSNLNWKNLVLRLGKILAAIGRKTFVSSLTAGPTKLERFPYASFFSRGIVDVDMVRSVPGRCSTLVSFANIRLGLKKLGRVDYFFLDICE